MQVERYRIVLTGWTMSGYQTHDVVTELSRLFKIPEGQIRPLLTGEPSIIRRDLTLEKAERLRNKIEQRGAVCSLKRVLRDEVHMRPDSDSFEHTGMLEPDLNMESTQFILADTPPDPVRPKPIRLKPGFFSQQRVDTSKRDLSKPQIMLLAGVLLVVVMLVLNLL